MKGPDTRFLSTLAVSNRMSIGWKLKLLAVEDGRDDGREKI
jgi:hypothetical protein